MAVVVAGDDLQSVSELMARDEKRLDVMVAVRPFAEHLKPQIQLDISLENHLYSERIAFSILAVSSSSSMPASTGATNEIICSTLASSSGMPLERM